MNLNFFPQKITQALNKCDLNLISEIRLRLNYIIKVIFNGQAYYLCDKGLTLLKENALICNQNDIDEIVRKATEFSVYAHNYRLKQGFLTVDGGIRIGVAGECVFENNINTTIKNITSLNVRIPHLIRGCSNGFYNKIVNKNKVFNTLIISPPFFGKTTMLKDIITKLNSENFENILVVDERGEFETINGENIDKIKFCEKSYAFEYSIRSLSPKIIICDELSNESEWNSLQQIINSGVKVIASCHGENLSGVKTKRYFKNIFDRYVLLSNLTVGKVLACFDNNFLEI